MKEALFEVSRKSWRARELASYDILKGKDEGYGTRSTSMAESESDRNNVKCVYLLLFRSHAVDSSLPAVLCFTILYLLPFS